MTIIYLETRPGSKFETEIEARQQLRGRGETKAAENLPRGKITDFHLFQPLF
jgi:hypothetical protein